MATNSRVARAKLIFKVVEVRLRFVAILVATGLVIGYWDSIRNHWDKWTRTARVRVAPAADTELYCPMHPSVVRATLEPNGEVPRCPICGMPLAERKKGTAAPLPPDVTGRVQISPERIRLAGIKTVEVVPRVLVRELATVGVVEYDESRLSRIVTRAAGYIEKLYVNTTFVSVTRDEPLAELYSPELYTAVQELLVASETRGDQLLEGMREKLRLLGVADAEIDDIVKTRRPRSRLVIRSPESGHVIHRAVVQGAHVNAGDTLFEIADLARVWVEADVFEKDIPFLREGQEVEASVESAPERAFMGRVSLVHPHLQSETRTNQVRFALDNPHHELRPGMFASVRIRTPLAELDPWKGIAAGGSGVLAVPESAVIDTGSRKVVYIERSPGLFEGVLVVLGPRVGEYYPVAAGLHPGDRVASAGAFLVDAETRLNPAAGSTFTGASGGGASGGGASGEPPRAGAAAAHVAADLTPDDRSAIAKQKKCPVSGDALGSMGDPVKVVLDGHPVFLCCDGCVAKARKDAAATVEKVQKLRGERP